MADCLGTFRRHSCRQRVEADSGRSRGNVCAHYKPASRRRRDAGSSPLRFIVSADFFFHLQSPLRRRCSPPSAPRPPHPRFTEPFASAVAHGAAPRRVYDTYGGRYVLWLIVLLSLTYFQFTAAARCFASWLSIVRDERRFMCQPECPGLCPCPLLPLASHPPPSGYSLHRAR